MQRLNTSLNFVFYVKLYIHNLKWSNETTLHFLSVYGKLTLFLRFTNTFMFNEVVFEFFAATETICLCRRENNWPF